MAGMADANDERPDPNRSSHRHQGGGRRVQFDQQAADFDERAGLPADVTQLIARELVGLAARAEGDCIVDLGAGTGEIGQWIIGPQRRYLGLDLSLPMLQVFAAKMLLHMSSRAGQQSSAVLAVANADSDWPLRTGSASVLFFSRAVHLLNPEHIVKESLRVARPDKAVLVLGRVRRSPDSIRALLRKEMQQQLKRHGIIGRKGEEAQRGLSTALAARGYRAPEPERILAASWTVEEQACVSLAAWRSKEGLAGERVPSKLQKTILDRLEDWGAERFGDLQAVHTAQEHYELTVIGLRTQGTS